MSEFGKMRELKKDREYDNKMLIRKRKTGA